MEGESHEVCLTWVQAVSKGMAGVRELLGEPEEVTLGQGEGVGPLSTWNNIFRVSQVRSSLPAAVSACQQCFRANVFVWVAGGVLTAGYCCWPGRRGLGGARRLGDRDQARDWSWHQGAL
jgi:hypothetical protein